MRLAVAALGIGGAVVGAIELLGRNQVADPVPFFLLLPGVLVGALTPDLGAISKLILFLVAVPLVPFVCLALPEEWRLSVFTSGIGLEFFVGAILYVAHSRWQARRRDYRQWLRMVQRRVSDL